MSDSIARQPADREPAAVAPDTVVVDLDMLDTDYAKMVGGVVIPEEKKQHLALEHYDFERLSRKIARYCYADLDQQGLDDILCSIGATAELFNVADIEEFNDRLRQTGCFYLTEGERQQVINWLRDDLGVELNSR